MEPFTRSRRTVLLAVAAVSVAVAGAGAALVASGAGRPGAVAGSPSPLLPPPPAAVSPSIPPPPECRHDDLLAASTAYGQWRRTLVDTIYALPSTYEPPALVPVSEAGFAEPFTIRRLVVRDLGRLREAAERAGHPIELVAAYRSHDQQADLFRRRENRLGFEEAVMKTARPGHSEHQLGTAIDVKIAGAPTVTVAFAGTTTGRWVLANAPRYGFVLSYPEGRESVTCYSFEPWHFRYFGPEMAGRIVESGLTVREFLWRMEQERRQG